MIVLCVNAGSSSVFLAAFASDASANAAPVGRNGRISQARRPGIPVDEARVLARQAVAAIAA